MFKLKVGRKGILKAAKMETGHDIAAGYTEREITRHERETNQAWKIYFIGCLFVTMIGFIWTIIHSYSNEWYMSVGDIVISTLLIFMGAALCFLVPLIFVIGDIDYRGVMKGDI